MAIKNGTRGRSTSSTSVAVEIGYGAVRVAEVMQRPGASASVKIGSAPFSAQAWPDVGSHAREIGTAIRAAMTSAGIQSEHVIGLLPRRLVTLKTAQLPHAAPEYVEGMVRFEAQQYIPFPMEQVVIDHYLLSDEGDELTSVLIAAARNDLASGLMQVFDAARLRVDGITITTLALAAHVPADVMACAIVRLEETEVEVTVSRAGKVAFTRAAQVSGSSSTEAGARAASIEIVRSISAYQNEMHAMPLDQILVTGGDSEVTAICNVLSQQVETPVRPLVGALLRGPDRGRYAAVIGAAAQAATASGPQVNLIPPERLERRSAAVRRTRSMVGAVVGAAVLLAVAAFTLQSMSSGQEQRKRDSMANSEMDKNKVRYERAKREHDDLARTYQALQSGLARNAPSLELVKGLSDSVPAKEPVRLTQLSMDRAGTTSIHGNARTQDGVAQIVRALRAGGHYADVRLTYIGDAMAAPVTVGTAQPAAAKIEAGINFVIACKLKSAVKPPSDRRRATAVASQAERAEVAQR